MIRIRGVLDILVHAATLLGFLPLFPYLGTLPRVFFVLAFCGGLVADRKGYRLGNRLATVVSVALFTFYAAQCSRENLVGPAANLLTVLMAVRLTGEKNARHYLQTFALALFALASYSLFNLNAVFIVYLLLLVVIIGVALVVLTFYSHDREAIFSRHGLKLVLTTAAVLPLAAIPLMLLFFFILPRTQYPLWDFLNVATVQTTGLSDTVRPGRAASAAEAKTVVFRAGMPQLAKDRLYWRAVVLNSYDGAAWVRRPLPPGEEDRPVGGQTVVQTIYPEPASTPYLVALNLPRRLSGVRSSVDADLVSRRAAAPGKRGKYEAVSVAGETLATPRGIDKRFYLGLPGGISPRLSDLARRVAGQGTPDARLRYLEGFYREAKFLYATTDMPTGDDSIDTFLFDKRRGNCEFFASSAALVLRAAGVPTRLVGGYYGGIYNEIGNYYVVTDDMAHVWLEVYLPGMGWKTLDPSSWASNAAVLGERGRFSLFRRVRLAIDAAGYFWNLTVINYDLDRQLKVLDQAQGTLRHFTWPAVRGWVSSAVLLPVLLAAFLAVFRRLRRTSQEERLLKAFLLRVRKCHHLAVSPSVGLYDLAASLDRPEIHAFVSVYGKAVYHDRKLTRDEATQLRRLLRSIG